MIPKFRAWNIESQCMLNHDFIVNTVIQNREIVRDFSDILEHNDMFILMLSTGLVDENQEEVFKDDIVWHDQNEEYGVVEFEEAKFVIRWQNGYVEDLFERIDLLEVVGNIHEHTELLKNDSE
ncbi:YopX family protein [Macrococcus armenti]|uniref:YopX family protein n=1 Tax=Macrococcus armenti TaxID=2875764 RepID=A0ABY3ZZY3_9STAP|nr:YopX family protein [Macrococcus armenti]UOB21494.1 YopX family protein [Macrococcus armenti]